MHHHLPKQTGAEWVTGKPVAGAASARGAAEEGSEAVVAARFGVAAAAIDARKGDKHMKKAPVC
ncbi:MAG: hypothetical protein DMG54_00210 [Acidobacteria bacterium]|nr:MAG: hypothetical protein DMG54_00210 [Acidobacteriota bacterium]PYU51958.1 MAG: hypothetical protein DMG53_00795 [Acidobacteriota bacterium]PYU76566.1 MAG: hypothetical protein DMG52_03615 [Acidobacteriota bacterium]